MRSLMNEAWSDSLFASLEGITISGNCRLRRIFTMRRQAPDTTDDDGSSLFFTVVDDVAVFCLVFILTFRHFSSSKIFTARNMM